MFWFIAWILGSRKAQIIWSLLLTLFVAFGLGQLSFCEGPIEPRETRENTPEGEEEDEESRIFIYLFDSILQKINKNLRHLPQKVLLCTHCFAPSFLSSHVPWWLWKIFATQQRFLAAGQGKRAWRPFQYDSNVKLIGLSPRGLWQSTVFKKKNISS